MARKRTLAEDRHTHTTTKRRRPDAKGGRVTGKLTAPISAGRHVSANIINKTSVTKQSVKFVGNTPPRQQFQVYVCGDGSAGELGLGNGKNVTDVKRPVPNAFLEGVVYVSTGGMHGAALTADGDILTWGINDHGTLGRDTTWEEQLRDMDDDDDDNDNDNDVPSSEDELAGLNPREATPTKIPADKFPMGTKFVQVAAGDSATFALTASGLVFGWGTFRGPNGIYGFTLIDDTKFRAGQIQKEPTQIPRLKNIVQISAGADYALALDIHGNVYAWGCGEQSELGRRILDRHRHEALLPSPVEIPRKVRIVSIHAALNHAFAIDSAGNTWAWGLNNFGQTGMSTGVGEGSAIITKPCKVPSLLGKNMKMVSGGLHHSIGLTQAGECLVWGRVDGSQSGLDLEKLLVTNPLSLLKDGRDWPRILLQPMPLEIPRCCSVASGTDHCLAVTNDGKVFSWGFNLNYQCGQGTSDDIMIASQINGSSIRDKKLVWADAGGQYSMLASHM